MTSGSCRPSRQAAKQGAKHQGRIVRRIDPPTKVADTLHRKTPAVKERVNVFNAGSAAGLGALDSLNCFVHGDAIDLEMTSHFDLRKRRRFQGIKPFAGHWFPREHGGELGVEKGYPLLVSKESFHLSQRDVQTACRMDLFARAKELEIQTEFVDGQGRRHVTDEAALKIILDALPPRAPYRFLGEAVVVRSGQPLRTEFKAAAKLPVRWKIVAEREVIAQGESQDDVIVWPENLPDGSYRLHLTDATSFTDDVPLIVTPLEAYGGDFDRGWLLAVQLYGVRS